jgi:hypothetical protein
VPETLLSGDSGARNFICSPLIRVSDCRFRSIGFVSSNTANIIAGKGGGGKKDNGLHGELQGKGLNDKVPAVQLFPDRLDHNVFRFLGGRLQCGPTAGGKQWSISQTNGAFIWHVEMPASGI